MPFCSGPRQLGQSSGSTSAAAARRQLEAPTSPPAPTRTIAKAARKRMGCRISYRDLLVGDILLLGRTKRERLANVVPSRIRLSARRASTRHTGRAKQGGKLRFSGSCSAGRHPSRGCRSPGRQPIYAARGGCARRRWPVNRTTRRPDRTWEGHDDQTFIRPIARCRTQRRNHDRLARRHADALAVQLHLCAPSPHSTI